MSETRKKTAAKKHVWRMGDEFEVKMDGGGVERGRICARDVDGNEWGFSSHATFARLARPVKKARK